MSREYPLWACRCSNEVVSGIHCTGCMSRNSMYIHTPHTPSGGRTDREREAGGVFRGRPSWDNDGEEIKVQRTRE